MTKDQVKSLAMQLDPRDREALAEELFLSINNEESSVIDSAWLAEVRRRDANFVAGRTSAKAVNEVVHRLLTRSQ